MEVVMSALQSDSSFDSAVECLCAIFKETKDVDENLDTIKALYPRLATLQPKIGQAADAEDWDTFKGVTRVFAEAGEA
ncbi:Nuclear import receptor, partial [Friedmanniomyces endolithicus]